MSATRFECGPIRERDENGRLIRAGAFWWERTNRTRYNRAAGWALGIIGLVLLISGFALTGTYGPFALALPLFAAPLLLVGGVLLGSKSPRREMAFAADGRTLTPLKLRHYSQVDWPLVPPGRFASIDVDEEGEGVLMRDSDGVERPIAADLDRPSATSVAAELNLALAEMRETMSR